MCLVIIVIDGIERKCRDVELVIKCSNLGNFLFGRHITVSQELQQTCLLCIVGTLEGIDKQESFFATKNVTANVLTKYGRIAIHIQIVILQLEGKTNAFGKLI